MEDSGRVAQQTAQDLEQGDQESDLDEEANLGVEAAEEQDQGCELV